MPLDRLTYSREQADFATRDIENMLETFRYEYRTLNRANWYHHLASNHVRLAVYANYIEGNGKDFKQHMHVATQLKLAAIRIDDYQRFTTGYEILYGLLSDNPALIKDVAQFESKYFIDGRANPSNSEFKLHMWQLAIQGDYEALQKKIDRLAKNGHKEDRVLSAERKDFFSLLICGDKASLESLIAKHAGIIVQGDPLTEDFISLRATIEAKICWLKGIEVDVNSALIPMELMPIAPLNRYEDVYDFLSLNYVPKKVGFLERLRYRLRERARTKQLLERKK